MKGILCLVACAIAMFGLLFVSADNAQACNAVSQQVQFQAVQAYSAPVVYQQQQVAAIEYAVTPQFVTTQQFIAAPVAYSQQVQQVNYVSAIATQPQFLNVGCSRAGCNRAAVRVGGGRRSSSVVVQRTRVRGR